MMRSAKRGWVLGSALLLAACAGGRTAGPGETFRLTEVGGRPLPVSYPEEAGCTEEVRSATLTLGADGAWQMAMDKRETCDGAVEEDRDVEAGTFTVAGATYRFTGPADADAAPGPGEIEIEKLVEGTLQGDVLTARLADGTALVFRRP